MTIHAQPAPPKGGKPLRVYLLLREEISNGVYPVGALLPGENRLADAHEVSRVTVRKALDALARDGWIAKKLGAGSVVLDRGAQAPGVSADLASLMPQIVEMGRDTTARLLAFSYGPAPGPVAEALALERASKVQTAVRVRSMAGQPFSHLTTHVPEDIARSYDEADLASQPLFRLLEWSGVKIANAQQSVTAAPAAPDVAEALALPVGSPLLALKRTVWDEAGRGVEYLSALYRPDLFRLEMAMTRVGAGEARHWEPVIGEGSA